MAQQIVVVGGGFAGLWAAASAARSRDAFGLGDACAITLVAPSPFHVIRVRCYEADLTPLRVPLDDVLAPIGVRRLQARVMEIDAPGHGVTVADEGSGVLSALPYARLILAAGSTLRRPAIPGIASAFDVDTYEGAQALATHLDQLGVTDPEPEGPGLWTAVVIGAGLVGLELACELPARLTAARERAGGVGPVRTILIDHAPQIDAAMGQAAQPAIQAALAAAGVTGIAGARIAALDPGGVSLTDGTRIAARTIVCATGMEASPLAARLGLPVDPLGRVPVDPYLQVTGCADLYAAGDIAVAPADAEGHRTVMSCQHARPMGRFAGHNAVCDLAGLPERRLPFSAPDYVTVLDLGAWGAVYTAGWDRGALVASGAAAKATKRLINGSRIYPPLDRDPAAIRAAAAPILQAPPATQGAHDRA
ncbi:MAG: FAD-dependent oxidoreductase [Parafilimonas terrae]|nr:FAD-dependent oxidoreductase [Parafilimonas terrae]